MDKMEFHLRQQLSAMMDGELASDEARFLFRRLQHDHELAGCWERWQVCSVVLRGQGEALLPADFSQRVARATALESSHSSFAVEHALAATGTHSRRWMWWGGGALAASLALLVVVPRTSDPVPDARGTTRVTATSPAMQPSASPDRSRSPLSPPTAGQFAAALAVADAPRRAAARRNRAASPDARRSPTPRVVEAAASSPRVAAADPISLPKRSNPFSSHDVSAQEALQAKPWPRAALPGANTGAFTASYSTGETVSFYPFEPRAVPEIQAAADGQH